MSTLELLKQYWEFAYDKEDWFPPLRDAVSGLTSEQADWRPEGEHANTIRETVHHLVFFKERLLQMLRTGNADYPEGLTNDDTFRTDGTDEASWNVLLNRLDSVHRALAAELDRMDEEELAKRVLKAEIGKRYMSLIAHDAYHTGAVIQTRKLQGSWPSRRSFD
ncbi:DinB family protein [Cohnella sp. REN36]|uniref:DinB family protein n=1 Tax=Cohnella sp. REN36 TaxID=2887347 RepID=UPI001D14F601|nr:DinB family protein [Cohnella sp. REN36]MCC3375542.1 DinB family protein [Cohnella sp. REN36]